MNIGKTGCITDSLGHTALIGRTRFEPNQAIPVHPSGYCYQCAQCLKYYDSKTEHACKPKERKPVTIEITEPLIFE